MSAAAVDAVEAPKQKKRLSKKLLIILIAVTVLLLTAGGAAFYVMKQRAAAAAAAAAENGEETADAAGEPEKKKKEHKGPPSFLPLDAFVVNLADRDQERYAQVGITLQIEDPKTAEELKLYMPAIRNGVLMILAHKTSAELLEREGKELLAEEIMREAVRPLGIELDPPAAAASGSSFIIQ